MHKDISEYFQITPEFIDLYNQRVLSGRKFLQDLNIGVVGITRDLEQTARQFFNVYLTLKKIAKQTNLFLYENDSIDNTVSILKQYKESDASFDFISENFDRQKYGTTKHVDRTEKLAEYRNKCLNYANENYQDKDYIIVIDPDFVDFSMGGLVNTFGWLQEDQTIDGMSGFSYEFKNTIWQQKTLWNYDCWAFRWTWWEDQQKFNYLPNTMAWFGLWTPILGSPPFLVNSAFGGCTTYKTKFYLKGEYSGEDCEHVTFHKRLKEQHNFNLYANPSQVMMF